MSANYCPSVSVVIPALNCEGEVEGCIAALRRQDYPSDLLQIVVVDNGSSDRTVEMLEKLPVKYVVHHDRGRSRALNAGLRNSRSEIVCTTDISCRPAPNWIRAIVKCFEDPTVGCVAGDIALIETTSNLAMRFQSRNDYMSPMHAISRRTLPYLPFADGANASFRRSLFDEIGGFDESFIKSADVEICYRMFVMTEYKLVFCREAIVRETGEQDLTALLRQRFRMGFGARLLKAKYPDFFIRHGSGPRLKQAYWSALGSGRELLRLVDFRNRAKMEDTTVRVLMGISQRLGRWYSRPYFKLKSIHPIPFDSKRVAAFLRNRDVLDQRVGIWQGRGE